MTQSNKLDINIETSIKKASEIIEKLTEENLMLSVEYRRKNAPNVTQSELVWNGFFVLDNVKKNIYHSFSTSDALIEIFKTQFLSKLSEHDKMVELLSEVLTDDQKTFYFRSNCSSAVSFEEITTSFKNAIQIVNNKNKIKSINKLMSDAESKFSSDKKHEIETTAILNNLDLLLK